MRTYVVTASPLLGKKLRAHLPDGSHVDFGAEGYSDYTEHRDKERMKLYLARHEKNENWTKSGVRTAGFWARWMLWSEPTLRAAAIRTSRVLGARVLVEL